MSGFRENLILWRRYASDDLRHDLFDQFIAAHGLIPFGKIFSTSVCGRGITCTAFTSPTLRAAAAPASVASFPARKVLPFCVAQLAGAFGGAVLAYSLYSSLFTDFESAHNIVRGSAESLQLASIFSTYPAAAINVWQAALVEVVITSMLMGLIMALTDDGNGVPKGPLAPLLIGILVAVIGASTGPLTGFAMNPARDFGPKIFTWLAGWGEIAMTGGRNIPYFIVPIIAPIIGVCVGAAIYRYLIAKNLPVNSVTPKEISE